MAKKKTKKKGVGEAKPPDPRYEDLLVLEDFTIYDAEAGEDIKVKKDSKICELPIDQRMKALRAYPDLSVITKNLERTIQFSTEQLSQIQSSRAWRRKNRLLAD